MYLQNLRISSTSTFAPHRPRGKPRSRASEKPRSRASMMLQMLDSVLRKCCARGGAQMCSSWCLFWRPPGRHSGRRQRGDAGFEVVQPRQGVRWPHKMGIARIQAGVREGHSGRRQRGDAGFEFMQPRPGVRWQAQDGNCARDARVHSGKPGVREGHSGKPGVREGQTKPATPRIAPACKHTFKVQIFKIQNHPQNPQTEPATPGRVSARKHDAPVIAVAPDLPTKHRPRGEQCMMLQGLLLMYLPNLHMRAPRRTNFAGSPRPFAPTSRLTNVHVLHAARAGCS